MTSERYRIESYTDHLNRFVICSCCGKEVLLVSGTHIEPHFKNCDEICVQSNHLYDGPSVRQTRILTFRFGGKSD